MTERERIIERLRAVDLGGGSHESLSAIAKAIYEPAGGWTIGACERLRQTLVRLLEEAEDVDQGARIIASDEGWDEGYKAGYDAGFASADDWCAEHEDAMAEHGWVRLPVDADGVPIRLKETMEGVDKYGSLKTVAGRVTAIIFEDAIDPAESATVAIRVWDVAGKASHTAYLDPNASIYRHHRPPTVDDVLREFICDHEEGVRDEVDLIAEYAAKLRLAGDAE